MAITTLAKVKAINNITTTNYDSLIANDIFVVQERIKNYTNNIYATAITVKSNKQNRLDFGYEVRDEYLLHTVGSYSILNNVITSTIDDDFNDFIIGDNIYIKGTIRNDGYYTILAVTDKTITVAEDIIDTTDDEVMYIYYIKWPIDVVDIANRMIGWDVKKRNKTAGLKNERVGTYFHTLQDIGGAGYPKDLVSGLKRYHTGA